jgi:hypothetical protein
MRKLASKGGKTSSKSMSASERQERAKKAAQARWSKNRKAAVLGASAVLSSISPAYAGQGWYLLLPPLDGTTRPAKFDPHAPLRVWDHFASFDSARDCEAQIRESSVKYFEQADNHPSPETLRAMFRGAWGRCIASDDPRLR